PGGLAIATADSPSATNDFMIAGTRANGISRISFQTGHADGSPNRILHAISPVNTGDWVHITCTRSQSTGEMSIHVNGQPEATLTGSTGPLDANPILSLGGNPEGAAVSYKGDLDQVRIHNRVLAAEEIRELFEESDALPPYDRWVAAWLPGLSHL